MGIIEEKDRNGKTHVVVSRRWPDSKRFRRYVPNGTVGKKLLARINESIAMGTWRELRAELDRGVTPGVTVRQFWAKFLAEYCKPRMASWSRYELSFRSINAELGDVPLVEFSKQHLHSYIKKRSSEVAANTVNRDIAACKKMFSYAFEVGALEHHPLVKFPTIKVQEKALRIPSAEEFRHLVASMPRPEIAALVAVVGETGMRKEEALGLVWSRVDLRRKRITTERTKGKRVRHIPLSGHAVEWLSKMVRWVGVPHVFVHPENGEPWRNPEKVFRAGRKAAGLEWVTLHTLRHFRGTSWIEHGADPASVKEGLGHADIRTTMRYVHMVESRADRALRDAQAVELDDLKGKAERAKSGRQEN